MATYIGTSGFVYKDWRGTFYPSDLPEREWLEYYAKHFKTVEINNSFYRLPPRRTFENWQRRTPADFLFTIKGSRFITHVKKLAEPADSIELFFDHAGGLRQKLDMVLWQLPGNYHAHPERLAKFCNELARHPIAKIVRQTFEFRHQSWFTEEIYEILSEHNYALCIADSPRWPLVEEVTADYVYIRFHGSNALYNANYTDRELESWAEKIQAWTHSRDGYIYFNNDFHGYAINNARTLAALLFKRSEN